MTEAREGLGNWGQQRLEVEYNRQVRLRVCCPELCSMGVEPMLHRETQQMEAVIPA